MPRERGAHCDRDHFLAVAQCGLDLGMKEGTFLFARQRGEPPTHLSLSPLHPSLDLSILWFLWRSIPLSSGQATAQVGKGHPKDQGEAEGLAGDRPRRQ